MLSGLQERIAAPGAHRYRKDMGGADPHLDIRATRINLERPIKEGEPLYVDYRDQEPLYRQGGRGWQSARS